MQGCRNCGGFIIERLEGETLKVIERLFPYRPPPPKVPAEVPAKLREAYEEAWGLQKASERAAAVRWHGGASS